MVTIKGGVLKGGTTRKKKHYMDDRAPQQMRATGYSAGTKVAGAPKKLEGALGPRTQPRSEPRTAPATAPRTTPRPVANTPKAKPARTSKPMPANIPRAEGKSTENYLVGTPRSSTSVSISNETAIGRGINKTLNWLKRPTNKKKRSTTTTTGHLRRMAYK